jgi:hypothetical protein
MAKKYTHSKGFNITSLEGVAGVYIFQKACGALSYIGMCNNDFKKWINSHAYGEHGKLTADIHNMHVVIVDPIKYPIHVIESLFIWYFYTPKNHTYWLFSKIDDEKTIIKKAKEKNVIIRGSIEEFLLSFECVVIKREWNDDHSFKRYGVREKLLSKKASCDRTVNCLCYSCLVQREKLK